MPVRKIYNNNMLNELRRIVNIYKPKKIIDFGTHIGTTANVFASCMDSDCNLITYDFGGDNKDIGNICYRNCDFYEWIKQDPIESFDLLYIDIHNTGDVIKLVREMLNDRIEAGIPVLFEGGTQDRDGLRPEAAWMLKQVPMYPLKDVVNYEILIDDFPGLSMFK